MNCIKKFDQLLDWLVLFSIAQGDTSGHYKHALYALIGEQRSS